MLCAFEAICLEDIYNVRSENAVQLNYEFNHFPALLTRIMPSGLVGPRKCLFSVVSTCLLEQDLLDSEPADIL